MTFGPSDTSWGVVCVGLTGIMLTIALTPLSVWILGDMLGIHGQVMHHANEVILVMCLMPLVIIARNYFHGTLMVRRRTGGMAAGGTLRVLVIAALAQIAYVMGWLDHVLAAFILLLGFGTETLAVLVSHNRLTGSATARDE